MMEISCGRVVREVLSLLYWSMLAACTVGPGTVVTCARAGAEFQLSLIYVLVFASAMAFILQVRHLRLNHTHSRSPFLYVSIALKMFSRKAAQG